jgi:tripartite motif-containing protein 71
MRHVGRLGLCFVAVLVMSSATAASASAEVTPLTVVTVSLPSGEFGAAYSQTLEASGGSTPYTWSLTAGSLPEGLTLNPETGAISGTPSATGTSTFTVKVTDSSTPTAETATASLSITVTELTFATSFQHYENIERLFGEAAAEPTAVVVGAGGNIYFADHSRIFEFNSKREYVRQFGEAGSGEGQFNAIGGIAIDAAGDLYVTGNDCVQEFSPDGKYLGKFGSFGSGEGQLSYPTGIAIDSAGDIWVLDSENYRVEEFDPEGKYLSQFGERGSGPGQIGWALSLAYSAGSLYVAEPYNSRVQQFSPDGKYERKFDENGSGNGKSNVPWGAAFGIAADPSTGNLYVVEGGMIPPGLGNNRVQEFSPEGSFITTFGSGGLLYSQLAGASGVAVGSSGKIYVADTGRRQVDEWVPASGPGEPPTYAASFTHYETVKFSELGDPDAVAVDPSGDIYVLDSDHEHVLEFNSQHQLLRQFGEGGGSGEGQFDGIGAMATDASGDVYVTDLGNDRVQEFSPSGEYLRQFGSYGSGDGQFNFPTGIAIDSAGNVWVLDRDNHRVQEFTATGGYLSQFGEKGPGEEKLGWGVGLAVSARHLYVSQWEFGKGGVQEFSTSGEYLGHFDEDLSNLPWGIATDPKTGNLYVAEAEHDLVREFSPEGSFIAAFGSRGDGDGQFSGPRGVAVNSSGDLFVADTGNQRVQEWVPGAGLADARPATAAVRATSAAPAINAVPDTAAFSLVNAAAPISGAAREVSTQARAKGPAGRVELVKCKTVNGKRHGRANVTRRCPSPRGQATKSSPRRASTRAQRP